MKIYRIKINRSKIEIEIEIDKIEIKTNRLKMKIEIDEDIVRHSWMDLLLKSNSDADKKKIRNTIVEAVVSKLYEYLEEVQSIHKSKKKASSAPSTGPGAPPTSSFFQLLIIS